MINEIDNIISRTSHDSSNSDLKPPYSFVLLISNFLHIILKIKYNTDRFLVIRVNTALNVTYQV